MCLAIPGKVAAINAQQGTIDYGGVTRQADMTLLPQAQVGDMVMVHAGFAIAVMDQAAGEELMRLTAELDSYGKA
ncbi:MAG: HypC/HybG/HupF family hydrogenase formation chaperone [Oscillospiraceae bacterium]|nr:HypC/HybG/HupF family hydrogenase formation chaperone [Oscillospiraceae bacterium]MDD4368173.1 HypC/HybG/HupF family hydrogenase formation chaperone [Oscillospiraceae bacterium]